MVRVARHRSGRFQPGVFVMGGVDRVLTARYPASLEYAARYRQDNPGATQRSVADHAIRRATKDVTLIGTASGATAAVPGFGTVGGTAAMGVDVAASAAVLADMIMRVGAAYGEPLEEIERRQAAIKYFEDDQD